MSSRKPGYLFGVIVLAIVLSFPQIALSFAFVWNSYSTRQSMTPFLPGLRETYYFHILQNLSILDGRLIHMHHIQQNSAGKFEQKITKVDPETGEFEFLPATLKFPGGLNHYRTWACGDRRWFYSAANSFYELIDGQLQPSNLAKHPNMDMGIHGFMLNGKPSLVTTAVWGIVVETYENGKWRTQGTVDGSEQIGDLSRSQGAPNMMTGSHPDVIECHGQHHLFWHWEGMLFHRVGIDVVPSSIESLLAESKSMGGNEDDVASALAVANRDPFSEGWTRVRSTPAMPFPFGAATHALMIGGQPAAFIIDGVHSSTPIGHLYRLVNGIWEEHSSIAIPFGTTSTAAIATENGHLSYLGLCTSQGGCFFYRIDEQGIHETAGSATAKCLGPTYASMGVPAFRPVWSMLSVIAFTLGLGIVSGVGTWILMWWYTRPDYGFGLSEVRLGSLLWRGIARLLDILLVFGSASGVGWFLTRGINWLAFYDALNVRLEHPSVPVVAMAAKVVAISIAVVTILIFTMQAQWGITPGKWICGLKTVRTSLRPCGFVSVLAREIVFFVDAGNLLCWSPGILSIALSDCRQRLGDIVGDTIVIETKSLNQPPLTSEGSTIADATNVGKDH
ncbi:RDD family protein [Schlesneria paludicola]|uniref:RDD family protein n=1 Tax=Schlesneria paludicola TaxID=360056 RepID=UPI00029A4EC4|nr:RDD family protein [Schlesneria paludicola]